MDNQSQATTKKPNYFKTIRIIILLAILLFIAWYSYAWWRFNKISQYESWSEGFAISTDDNNKKGYVNENFDLVIRHSFDIAYPFKDGRAMIGTSYGKNYRYRLINQQGKYIGEFYDEIKELGDGFYKVRNNKGNKLPENEKDYAWQLMNRDGQIIGQKIYTLIDPFSQERARVCILEKCGFINTSGRMVANLGTVSNEKRYQQVYNFSGDGPQNMLEDGQHFSDGLARTYKNGKVGFIDQKGNMLINPQFLDAQNFHENLAVVLTKDGYGVIDKKGDFVIKPNKEFDGLNSFYQGLAIFKKQGYQGVIDNRGNIVVDIDRQYSYISNFKDGVANIIRYNLHGFIDTTGKEIIPPIYQNLGGEFVDGTVWAINQQMNEMVYLDKNNNIVGKGKITVY